MKNDTVVRLAISLPRGGGRALRYLSRLFPSLRAYPVPLALPPGATVNADLSDSVFFPLLKHGAFPHQITEDFITSCLLRPGDTVIDVGANIGHVSALCAHYVGTSGVVYAFEPSRSTHKYIKQLSQQIPQIRPVPYAATDTGGIVQFIEGNTSDLSRISQSDENSSYPVPSVTLDSWGSTNLERLDFLKVDAEGFDLEVIRGASDLLSRFAPIVEFEAFTADAVSEIHSALNDAPGRPYTIYRVYNRYPFSLIATNERTNNYFAIPDDDRNEPILGFLLSRGFLEPPPQPPPQPGNENTT